MLQFLDMVCFHFALGVRAHQLQKMDSYFPWYDQHMIFKDVQFFLLVTALGLCVKRTLVTIYNITNNLYSTLLWDIQFLFYDSISFLYLLPSQKKSQLYQFMYLMQYVCLCVYLAHSRGIYLHVLLH